MILYQSEWLLGLSKWEVAENFMIKIVIGLLLMAAGIFIGASSISEDEISLLAGIGLGLAVGGASLFGVGLMVFF